MKRYFSSAPSTHGTGTLSYIYKRLRFVQTHRKMLDDEFVTKPNHIAFWVIPCTASASILFFANA